MFRSLLICLSILGGCFCRYSGTATTRTLPSRRAALRERSRPSGRPTSRCLLLDLNPGGQLSRLCVFRDSNTEAQRLRDGEQGREPRLSGWTRRGAGRPPESMGTRSPLDAALHVPGPGSAPLRGSGDRPLSTCRGQRQGGVRESCRLARQALGPLASPCGVHPRPGSRSAASDPDLVRSRRHRAMIVSSG